MNACFYISGPNVHNERRTFAFIWFPNFQQPYIYISVAAVTNTDIKIMPFCFTNLQVFDKSQKAITLPLGTQASQSDHFFSSMSSDTTGVFGALGAVLGYIGAEVATKQVFFGLLWPQRAYADITWRMAPTLALLPMGGPLHSVALKTLDVMFKHKLFQGDRIGHMLGTAFFLDQKWEFVVWDKTGLKSKPESSRNCLWVRALSRIPIPDLLLQKGSTNDGEKAIENPRRIRAKMSVNHLTITKATDTDKQDASIPFIQEHTTACSIKVIASIFITEISAILVAIGLASILRSLWAVWWLAPLFLRLLSAIFSPRRDKLQSLSESSSNEENVHFEVQIPQPEGNFMLISGPESVARQFFTHYGHPERHRAYEIIQLTIIVIFGSLFPMGLFLSVLWMPIEIQYVWLSHQVFVGLLMLVVRYSHASTYTSTEAIIARQLAKGHSTTPTNASKETMILFGHDRSGSETVKVSFTATYHQRYMHARESMKYFLQKVRVGEKNTILDDCKYWKGDGSSDVVSVSE